MGHLISRDTSPWLSDPVQFVFMEQMLSSFVSCSEMNCVPRGYLSPCLFADTKWNLTEAGREKLTRIKEFPPLRGQDRSVVFESLSKETLTQTFFISNETSPTSSLQDTFPSSLDTQAVVKAFLALGCLLSCMPWPQLVSISWSHV